VFKPSFPAASFVEVSPKDFADTPFRVIFAGRIEENKGVFDILDMAEALPHVDFSLCGDGDALPDLRRQIDARRLQNVTTHGKLDRPHLLNRYLEAHVAIVPTRSTFEEGFAMVVAEAILLLRPVISSPVVPAAEVLHSAVLSVPTDDVGCYVDAIRSLSDSRDGGAYSRLVDEAAALRSCILDDSTSLLEVLRATRKSILP
jgi:glycogen(starch) synthase